MPIAIPTPQLQIDFAFALEQIRSLFLQEALSETVSKLDIRTIDAELAQFVEASGLSTLAKHGLRGELMFAVPCVLSANVRLIAYYKLLLGFSQKEFYSSKLGLASFQAMEKTGTAPAAAAARVPELCRALNGASHILLKGIGTRRISKELLDDLALLTVGPQLRGGYNVKRGLAAIVKVFDTVSLIVAHATVEQEPNRIEIENAAGRRVFIEFAPDPDIIIREEIASEQYRHIIAIEVKGGTDFSNIHNRLGEAEKSHQKASANGYTECWTVVNVERIDITMARRESPSTDRFYLLSHLERRSGAEYQDFYNRLLALTGIRPSGQKARLRRTMKKARRRVSRRL